MEIMEIIAFSVASCSLAIAIIAHAKCEKLEKRIKELENKVNEK